MCRRNTPARNNTSSTPRVTRSSISTRRRPRSKRPPRSKSELDAEQRQLRDKNLLSTYASVQEIERLRDQRLTLLADQIKVTNQFLDTLNGRMKKMRADSMRFRPYSSDPKAPRMPDQVAEDLVRLAADMRTQEQNLKQKRSEESTMSIQFESDIDRFKELKHIQ